MEYTEAKVGNWVLVPTGLKNLSDTSQHKIVKLEEHETFAFKINGKFLYRTAANCHGIPITRPWLKFNNFSYDKESNTYFLMNIRLKHYAGTSVFSFSWLDSSENGLDMRYIHELQNAYLEKKKTEFPIKFNSTI